MKKILSSLAAGALILASYPVSPVSAAAAGKMHDSGLSYTEYVGTIENPGMGYTSTLWYNCKPGGTEPKSPSGQIVLMFIDIGAFSSGINGTTDSEGNYTEGTDYDLDDVFFSSLRQTFENCRKNGSMIAVRFRYDANGKKNPEPASFDQVLHHIEQIKENGLLEDYKDILAFVECGFVGAWGEMHSGKYTSVEYKAKLLDAMLDCVPSPVPVTVRTPDIFAKWAGISRSELKGYVSEPGSTTQRVGMYDDGYMGSDSDLGTYSDRSGETDWLGRQAVTSYFGGEFSGDLDWAKKFGTYLPENAIPEMYKTHLSYINGNIFQLYKDYTFGKEYDVEGVDNSAYYGQTVFQFIRDHIGYRFVLRKSELSDSVEQGGVLDLSFNVENTGFANPIPDQTSYLLLEHDNRFMMIDTPINTNQWYSGSIAENNISVKLPGTIEAGKWNVYLKTVCGGKPDMNAFDKRSVRFANEGVWNSLYGADLLGSFTVEASAEQNNDSSISIVGTDIRGSGELFSFADRTIVDGTVSFDGEWTDDMIIAQKDALSISVKSDENYFYIMSRMPEGSSAPVYNISLKNKDSGESYWLYYASNGYVYFDHKDYTGCMCKWSGDTVEFAIPFGDVMGLAPGTEVSSLRVFLQDSGNDWKLMGDITSPAFKIPEKTSSPDGDINNDGKTDVADLVLLRKHIHNIQPLTVSQAERADICSDNCIDVFDCIMLKQLIIGIN